MPYFISDEMEDCTFWAVVKDDGEVIACHDTKQSAIDQMVAISLAEGIEPGGTYTESSRSAVDNESETRDTDPCEDCDGACEVCSQNRSAEASSKVKQEVRADLTSLLVGNYVKWEAGTESFLGRIVEINEEWLRVMLYQEQDGFWVESDIIAVIKAAQVTKTTLMEDQESQPESQEEDLVDDSEQGYSEQREVNLDPPSYMRAAARQGLKYYEEGLGGDGLVSKTISEARAMAAGNVTADKWVRLRAWISRHLGDLDSPSAKPSSEDYPSAGVVAHLLWGSGPSKRAAQRALKYAEGVVARLEAENSDRSTARGEAMSKVETRYHVTDIEVREYEEGMRFTGYAALFNSRSQPLPFIEVIEPGAFRRSIDSRNDIKLLWNHSTSDVLGSTRAKTMKLYEDARGLRVEADLPNTTLGRDAAELLRRGDVDSMSFGFSVPSGGDEWSADGMTRTLKSVRLHEVSIVAFPAYSETAGTTSVRALETVAKRAQVSEDDLADAMLKIEEGKTLTAEENSLLTKVINSLSETSETDAEPEAKEDNGDVLALKKAKLKLLMDRI